MLQTRRCTATTWGRWAERLTIQAIQSSMSMDVVGVRHVGMRMLLRLMPVSVAVLPSGHGVVRVHVVSIVMAVGMFMIQRLVRVRVAV